MNRSCPCLYTTPCIPRCTCVVPTSSSGCRRCCSYGSMEQRQAKAEALVAKMENVITSPYDNPLPDDLRAEGWTVAVHNDYRLNNEPYTFWLFTRGDYAVKGEGRTDAEALRKVRMQLYARRKLTPPPLDGEKS